MTSPIDIFAAGARDGVYPGGQLVISREGVRQVTVSVGKLGPGLPDTDDHVAYDLASLTKPLSTAVLVARAVERGLLALDLPLARLVPGVDPRVTVAHVLEHSAGFPAHKRFDATLPGSLPPGSWDAWRYVIREAAATPLERTPGEEAVYSDLGFILLGAALEVAYGMPLSTAHVLTGTGLTFRDRRGPPALPPFPLVRGVAPTEGGKVGVVHDENAEVMGGAAGHAGLFGTAAAVVTVAEQWLYAYHGGRDGLVSPELARRFWQPSQVVGSTRTLGWDRPSAEGASTGGQWPAHSVGHLGFTGTSVWIEPERGLIAVLVTNRVCPSRANNLIRRLRPLLHDAIWREYAAPKTRATTKTAAPRSDTVVTGSTPPPRGSDDDDDMLTRRIGTPPPARSLARPESSPSAADDEETIDTRP